MQSAEPTKNRPKRLVSFRLNPNGVFEKTTKKILENLMFSRIDLVAGTGFEPRDLRVMSFASLVPFWSV